MRAPRKYSTRKRNYNVFRRIVGKASGSTLGYVVGNVPGAVAGYKLGGYLAGGVSKRSTNYDGITTQKDDRLAYKKRTMPRRKKKAWKKFSKKVAAVSLKDRGLNVLKCNKQTISAVSVPSLGQAYKAFHLYSKANNTVAKTYDEGLGDMAALLADPNLKAHNWIKQVGGVPNPTIPQDNYGWQKIRMQSAVLDVYIKNDGTVPIVAQIYHLWYHKNMLVGSFTDQLANFTTQDVPLQIGTTSSVTARNSLSLGNRGVTLFDMPELLGSLAASVRSVREVYITPGNLHTLQIRDPKNHLIDLNQLLGTGYTDRKLTETVVVVCKNLDGTTAGSVTMYSDRTYRYTVEGITQDHTGFAFVDN